MTRKNRSNQSMSKEKGTRIRSHFTPSNRLVQNNNQKEVSKIRNGQFREVAQTAVVVNTWQRAYISLSRDDSVVKMSGSKVETDTELENLRRRVLELTPAPGWSRPVVVEPNADVELLRRRVSEMEAKAAGEGKEGEGDQERVNDSKEAK